MWVERITERVAYDLRSRCFHCFSLCPTDHRRRRLPAHYWVSGEERTFMNCPICRQPMSTFIQKGFSTDTEQAECRDETCDFHMVTLSPEEHARLTPMQIE